MPQMGQVVVPLRRGNSIQSDPMTFSATEDFLLHNQFMVVTASQLAIGAIQPVTHIPYMCVG
jgi:hypothetical protein